MRVSLSGLLGQGCGRESEATEVAPLVIIGDKIAIGDGTLRFEIDTRA